jgi:hypothetical protein
MIVMFWISWCLLNWWKSIENFRVTLPGYIGFRVGYEILWVSALAYPNLFGNKGFVVVVVTRIYWR